jgi:radical SAM superfamily enzyme YgiQ (UPF0313 family)
MVKKLLLVNPVQDAGLNLSSVSLLRLSPTSLAYLAALTPFDWNVKIIDENVEPVTYEDADLVGVTAITTNAPRAYEISGKYRQKGIKTVMGGIHASMLPQEAIEYTDSVVIGEAESVWQSVLSDFEKKELKPFYKGEHIPLENLPRPRRDLYYSGKYRFSFVQTARGCPNDCEFCSVTVFNGHKYRQRPIEEVVDELEGVEGKNLFFMDDNILGYGRLAEDRAIKLFRRIYESRLNKRWACQVGIDIANNPEVLKWAKKAGCVMMFIGFESVNEETLRSMHKARNLKVGVGNYIDVIHRIHDHGIGVHGAFVFGGDGDRKDVFPKTIEFVLESKIDSAQLTLLTPLPGTRLYNRLRQEGRLLHTSYPEDWKRYDFTEATFRPKYMTPDELEEGVAQVYLHTTSRLASLKRAVSSLLRTGSPQIAAVGYLWNRGYGSLCVRNYEFKRNAAPAKVGVRELLRGVPPERKGDVELIESCK